MEEKKRTLLAVVISAIILLAVLYSFGLNLFVEPPGILVAPPETEGTSQPGTDVGDGGGIPVGVTPETVQALIAHLSRYPSYSRTITIRYHWGEEESGTVTVLVRTDGAWTRCDTVLSNGVEEHSIWGDGTLWLWYGQQKKWISLPAEKNGADLMQYIPTYEDVLEVAQEAIAAADYEEKGGLPCIRVDVQREDTHYRERYWISVDSGLLVCAETEKEGRVVYSMSSFEVSSPLEDADSFCLPDGTVLYALERD